MANRPAFDGARMFGPRAERKNSRSTASGNALTGLWHRPEMMNLIADVLMLVASAAIGYAAVRMVMNLSVFALQEVVVTTPLRHVTTQQIEFASQAGLRGGFFSIKLEAAREAFEKLPWVRQAEIRRHWPQGVELRLEEHIAVAHWRSGETGEERLVNDRGEVFMASTNAELPWFSGPESSASLLFERYQHFNQSLQKLQRHIVAIALSARQAWQIKLDNGLVLELGRDQVKSSVEERLNRFIAAYNPLVQKIEAPIAVVDLRYPSGFAVRVAQSQQKSKK